MKFSLVAIISAISTTPVEVNKRAWMTGYKALWMEAPDKLPTIKVTSKFKIVLGSENAKQYRYRLRFTQLDGYPNSVPISLRAVPNENGVVRFNSTDYETEEWNAVGSNVILDRILPGSGEWQKEEAFNVACSTIGILNNFAYAGTFTFNCALQ